VHTASTWWGRNKQAAGYCKYKKCQIFHTPMQLCGRIFNNDVITNSLPSLAVKQLSKSFSHLVKYGQDTLAPFSVTVTTARVFLQHHVRLKLRITASASHRPKVDYQRDRWSHPCRQLTTDSVEQVGTGSDAMMAARQGWNDHNSRMTSQSSLHQFSLHL